MRRVRMSMMAVVGALGVMTASGPATLAGTPPPDTYKMSIYNSYGEKQHTDCWCVVAAAETWIRYIPGLADPNQQTIAPYMLNHDRYESMWRNNPCHQTDPGYEDYNPSYANDSLGFAWAMYHWAGGWGTNGLGFKDFKGSQATMNWKIILGVRSTSWPVGVTVKHGHHEILVVGFETTADPKFYDSTQNDIWGFRIWDPWHNPAVGGVPFNGFSSWPYNGYAGNAYITIDTWNGSIFTDDTAEGSYYSGKYVAVLRSASVASPDLNPGPDYGTSWFTGINGSAPALETTASSTDTTSTSTSIDSAVAHGLSTNNLFGDTDLGNISHKYSLGRGVHVDSYDPDAPSYELVEVLDGGTTVAIAMVNDQADGTYAFGGLYGIVPGTRLPTQGQMNADAARAGLQGQAHLEFGPTAEGAPPTMPFLVASDGHGRPAFAGQAAATPLFAAH